MKKGRIKNISYSNGMPVHFLRVGDIVDIEMVNIFSIGSNGVYKPMKTYEVRLKGDPRPYSVTEHDLEEI